MCDEGHTPYKQTGVCGVCFSPEEVISGESRAVGRGGLDVFTPQRHVSLSLFPHCDHTGKRARRGVLLLPWSLD